MGSLTDPFGHRWTLSTPIAGFDRAEYARISKDEGYELIEGRQLKHHNEGDLYYFTLPVHDLSRAQAFFTAVLGWQFPDPQQGHIANISAPPGGIAVSHLADIPMFLLLRSGPGEMLPVGRFLC